MQTESISVLNLPFHWVYHIYHLQIHSCRLFTQSLHCKLHNFKDMKITTKIYDNIWHIIINMECHTHCSIIMEYYTNLTIVLEYHKYCTMIMEYECNFLLIKKHLVLNCCGKAHQKIGKIGLSNFLQSVWS